MLDTTENTGVATHERQPGRPRVAGLPSGSRPAWCVVATLPKAERRAHASLHRFGLDAYLPLLTTRWRDRTWHTGPLFPGYCFVRLDLDRPWSPVKHAPGVFTLLSIDGIPSICPDAVLSVLQASEALRATPTPTSASWAPGMACSLRKGYAFEGLPAVVTAIEPGDVASVSIMFLGQLRNVSLPLDCLVGRDE